MKELIKVPAKLKYRPQDFIVEEIGENWNCKVSEKFMPNSMPNTNNLDSENSKDFLCCELEKQNIEQFRAMKELADKLNLKVIDIGYAGTKDKVAWTSQRISIFKPNLEILKEFNHPNIILKNFKWSKRKIRMGYLDANHFLITLRDIDKKDAMKIANQIKKIKTFPNYFGPQRFGTEGNNYEIGKLIIKKKFKEAVDMILKDTTRDNNFSRMYKEGNYLDIIRNFDRKKTLIFVNSVQSKLFNEILERALDEGLDFTKEGQRSIILAGYKMKFSPGRLGEIEQQVLEDNCIGLEDFDIKEIPYLRIKGALRKALVEIKNTEVEISDDEFFENSKNITLSFTLPSGVYATTFLENFFKFE